MSPRSSGVDESGRPIVAELGRAETPQETAERKSASSARRRSNQTVLNLAIATVVSALAAIAIVWTVGLVDTGSRIDPVDFRAETAAAQSSFDNALVAPELPDSWQANRAWLDNSGDVASWRIGLVTPNDQYIALVQTQDANPSWISAQVRGAKSGATVRIGGSDWTIYDRRDVDDPGNVAYALVTVSGTTTIVLAGTADETAFEQLASAVAKGLT
ncbi:MAG: DUF4245 domain-containing protein [Leifsonia xyli]|nr:MAG: DUF4245 domain-containing protein [Leifsonia xyli]